MKTMKSMILMTALAALGTAAGCYSDRPHDYGQQRPPVDQIDERDRGLQSKDIVSATDQLSMDQLALPELNDSKTRWTRVVTGVENYTQDPRFDYQIFIERLRTTLSQHGRDRIALIENKDRLRDLQSSERDDMPKGSRSSAEIQPDFALYGKILELPNRATSYYQCQFDVTDLRTRELIWSRAYEVKVER
jgi:hypothetical protein